MASGNYDIICEQGSTFRININYYNNSGAAYNLVPSDQPSKYWLRMDVRNALYEQNTSDSALIIRFSTENPFPYTGLLSGEGKKFAGHASLRGAMLDLPDGGTAAPSGVTGQISLFLSHHTTEQMASGTYLYDMFLYEDTFTGSHTGAAGWTAGGHTSGTTADAIAHKLLQGKFIVIPSVTEPSPDIL
tara:strand:+ start:320 stop:883 length:564 start_codon:yes stop_codon:yes gene_type:complete